MSSGEINSKRINSTEDVIEVFNLTKKYPIKGKTKFITALDNINLKIKNGEIFGLLGPNGAGKTTMVSILTTLKQPTSGYAKIFGHNILTKSWYVRENVGLMLGGEMIYARLTGYKNLKFFAKLYGIKNYKSRIEDLVEMFDLSDWLNQYVSNYSMGMKLKLALIRVLLTEPKILFLDEPMLGLDPKSVEIVINLLKNLNKTIFLTSHQLHIVSRICDRIAFLNEGKILKIDTKENLRKLISEKIKIQLEVAKRKDDLLRSLKQLNYIDQISEEENKITLFMNNENYFPELFGFLKDFPIIHFNELKPSLSDIFLKIIY